MKPLSSNRIKTIEGAEIQKEQFQKLGQPYFTCVVEYKAVRFCLTELYRLLVQEKKCLPLEQLSAKEKADLWEEAKSLAPYKSKTEVIEICKALHALGSYLQQ